MNVPAHSSLGYRLRAIDFNSESRAGIARRVVPIVFGFVSVHLGQDTNWDLYNHDLYNAFAWLGGKLHVALAGLGTGLKLTNGVYALVLCAALLAYPASWGGGVA
jgi:hypothetical protein